MVSAVNDTDDVLIQAHKHSMHNRPFLTGQARCGCFHCLEFYSVNEIMDWTDDGQTAICPRCGVDAVLSTCTDSLTADFLARMHVRWFEQVAGPAPFDRQSALEEAPAKACSTGETRHAGD